MFTDERRRIVWDQIRENDLLAFAKVLSGPLLAAAAERAGLEPGRGPLRLCNLAWLSIACALHQGKNFCDVLVLTIKLMQDADNWGRNPLSRLCRPGKAKGRSKHDPRPANSTALSEEAFAQARSKMPPSYWVALIFLLGEKFCREHGSMLYYGAYRLLALDGTTIGLPRWGRLRTHFGSAANGKGARQTQARMVMIGFPQARIPWRYELSPLSRSEKTSARSLLQGLAANDLVLMDKGFWSYGLFWQIAAAQAFFAIRLFKGVAPKTLCQLGKDDRLARWSPSDRKWKDLPPHIDLRVMRYQIPGFRSTALVTNLTDRTITRDQWVRLASDDAAGITLGGLYHRRWQIETTFNELKVHQHMEGGLRGRTAKTIEYEVAGHVLLYLLTRWLMVEAAQKAGVDPLRLSHCQALRELQDMAPALLTARPHRVAHVLIPRLLKRVAAHTVPLRPGRHYPRPGDTKVKNKGKGKYQRPSKLKRTKA